MRARSCRSRSCNSCEPRGASKGGGSHGDSVKKGGGRKREREERPAKSDVGIRPMRLNRHGVGRERLKRKGGGAGTMVTVMLLLLLLLRQ